MGEDNNGRTGQIVATYIKPNTRSKRGGGQSASSKSTRTRSRRTVRSIMRQQFQDAPGGLLDMLEHHLQSSKLEDLVNLDVSAGVSAINEGIVEYALKVINGEEGLTKGFEDDLREYADKHRIDYGSMITYRGSAVLIEAINDIIGYNMDVTVKRIIKSAS